MELTGKTILVVGGATGIGRATAQLCAKRGARVIVADFNTSDGAETARTIGCEFVQVDVSDEASVAAMCAAVARNNNKLDGLIQTAGVLKGAYVSIDDFDVATFRKVIDVNTVGSFMCVKYAAPLLRKGVKPAVVLLSSVAASGVSSSYAYGTSKGGVSALGITMAGKLAEEGIRVNTVCPGGISTAMKLGVIEEDARLRGLDQKKVLEDARRELGDPEGVAKVLAFLVSDEADYVRGSMFTR